MSDPIVIATRESRLALWQAEHVRALLARRLGRQAELLGMTEVPCLRLETMTPDEKRAYVIADNKLALNAIAAVHAHEAHFVAARGRNLDASRQRTSQNPCQHHGFE